MKVRPTREAEQLRGSKRAADEDMRLLLLVLTVLHPDSFAADREAINVRACANGWVELSCRYPDTSIRYRSADVVLPEGQQHLQSSESDRWENKGSVQLYHDTTHRNLRVRLKQLNTEHFGRFQCRFYRGAGSDFESSKPVDLAPDDKCETFTQTANTAGKTTLTCHSKRMNQALFFCKDKDLICEEILPTSSLSFGRFTLGVTSDNNVSLSITDVNPGDAGVYWCGRKDMDGLYRAAVAGITLEVKGPAATTTAAKPEDSTISTTSPSSDSAGDSTISTTSPASDSAGGGSVTVIIAVLVFLALLASLLLSFVVYRRLNKREEHIYAEIQEKPDSGTVMNTLYQSADLVSATGPGVQASDGYFTVGQHVRAVEPPPADALYSTIDLP